MNVSISKLLMRKTRRIPLSFNQTQIQFRCLSSPKKSVNKRKENLKIISEPPVNRTSDYIGPPHPASNIRPVQFHIPVDETQTEKNFRLQRTDTLEWNQQFWERHNRSFFHEKNEYTKKIKEQKGIKKDEKESLSAQEMSVFYKHFLDANRSSHLQYNKEWYKKNFSLLLPAMKVTGIKIWRALKPNKPPK